MEVGEYFSNGPLEVSSYVHFLYDHGLTTALLAAVLAVYWLSRRCVKTELMIVRQLFSSTRLPQNWTYIVGSNEIIKLILVYIATYFAIAWFIDDVRVVSAAFIAIFLINYRNMKLTQATMRKYLSEPALEPREEDEHRDFIMLRREAAEDYIFNKPHLNKEIAGAAGSTVSLVLGLIGYAFDRNYLVIAATLIMILTLVCNEVIVFCWRVVRN